MAASKPVVGTFPIILDISKLSQIVQILKQYKFPEAKWFELGLNLGLLHPTLEAIEATHRGNTSRCLMECLTKWLSKSDKSVYPLTWQSLAIATRRSNVTTVAENVQKTMVDPASQLLQHYSSRISQAILSEESVDLLHTEGLISEETMREVKSCGHTLFDGTMKEIYTAVANDHNKLKSFALILFKTKDTANMANELMRHCEDVIFESESAPEDNSDPVISSAIEETRVQMTEFEFQISEEYTYHFDKMRGGFGSFYFKVTRLISCTITVNLLEEFIEFVDDCYPELGPNLASAATVKDVMKAIRTKCNVINIAPVEEVVSFYSIKEAKPLITDYKVTVDEFCCTFKLQFLLDKKLSTSDFLVCETIEFVLDWDPAEHLLNDIRRLMEKAFKGLSRRIIVKSMHKGNSIIIICGAPGHLINALQLRARDNLSVLQQEFDLMRLKIGHYTVYDIMIKKKEQKIIAEQIEMCEGEIQKLNPYNDDNKNLLNNRAPKILSLIKNQEFIRSTMKSSDYKLKLKQIEREKSASTKKRMLLRENEHLQSTLRVRIIQKEALQHNEQEIEKLQESISFISVQLLNNKEKLTHVFTQTTLSSSGSICVAQADYNNTIISFKKGEIFQLSKNGYEVQSLETGQKGAVPISCVGPSLLESLHLFQFAMTNQTLPLPPILLDETISDDEKAKHFIKIIADDNHTLQLLRTQNFKQHKFFVAIYYRQAYTEQDLSFKKGEVLEVIENRDNKQWYMCSLNTYNKGYVPSNYIVPIDDENMLKHYKCVYYHIVSRLEAEERLSQADTQSGTFLIRESESRPGSCSLSLNFRGSILHYLLYNHNNTYCISDQVKFNSLNELLQYYMLIADYLPCTLTVPVFKPVNRLIERDERWEIEKSSIRVMNCTDIREFGEIFMGYWHNKGSVLIKTNITADITQERFLKEANILKKLNYESIICLYGVCTKEYPFYIVTELMNHGNLKKHLSRYSFAPAELIYITAQVVNGMIYLGEQYYIHCDLRAANILVGEYNTVKIANFHFAQHLNGNKYWIIEERTKLAIRWTAPEWHTLNRLGIKSDVWSFGILLWELVTKGNLPYPGMTNVEVVEAVPQGYRMIIPEDCPEPFQQLMVNCWEQNDDERPHFEDIFETLVKHKNSFI